jgi:hypothetical protein
MHHTTFWAVRITATHFGWGLAAAVWGTGLLVWWESEGGAGREAPWGGPRAEGGRALRSDVIIPNLGSADGWDRSTTLVYMLRIDENTAYVANLTHGHTHWMMNRESSNQFILPQRGNPHSPLPALPTSPVGLLAIW